MWVDNVLVHDGYISIYEILLFELRIELNFQCSQMYAEKFSRESMISIFLYIQIEISIP